MRGLLTFLIAVLFSGQAFAEKLVLTEADLQKAVKAEFAEQGIDGDLEIEFFGGQTVFELENAKQAKILVSNLSAGEGQNKFTAEAAIFADGKPAGQTALVGRYFVTEEIWLPLKDIEKDAIITEADLYQGHIRSNRLREDTVIARDNLLGKQAVRQIKADKPVTVRDIRDEVLIKKGQTATVVYTHKGLQITSKAEALENGSKGQNIKFLNTKSGKEITGKVLDKNTAEIAAE